MDVETLRRWLASPAEADEGWRAALGAGRGFLESDPPAAEGISALPAELQLALVERLRADRDPGRLGLIKAETRHKAVRKAAGKALHHLRSQGVAGDVAAPADGRKGKVVFAPPEPPASLASTCWRCSSRSTATRGRRWRFSRRRARSASRTWRPRATRWSTPSGATSSTTTN